MTVYATEVAVVNRGSHRRGRPAPERWWWFALVTSPAWVQVLILPSLQGTPAYELAVAGLTVGFLGYLWYFVWNRRRHDRMRRDDTTTGVG